MRIVAEVGAVAVVQKTDLFNSSVTGFALTSTGRACSLRKAVRIRPEPSPETAFSLR